MRPIIIGAGRGSRLEHLTQEVPKTLVEVMGRPMLDWILDSLREAGFCRRDVVFICGYGADVVRSRYPEFTFVENRAWATNNILASLLTAREYLHEGFISSYADIVYRGAIVSSLAASPHHITLGCDTDWRRRYIHRSRHPESDAEKMRTDGLDRVVELSRRIPSDRATGEFIGVAKFTPEGAEQLLQAFDAADRRTGGGPYREGRDFVRAYLIDLLAEMLENETPIHASKMHGGYMEIDTVEDRNLAHVFWNGG